jgi:hypothetical protein
MRAIASPTKPRRVNVKRAAQIPSKMSKQWIPARFDISQQTSADSEALGKNLLTLVAITPANKCECRADFPIPNGVGFSPDIFLLFWQTNK